MMYCNGSKKKRFFSKVLINEGCWIWQASKDEKGYGYFGIKNKEKWKMMRAHRASWEIHEGKIPKGMYVCHKCDTPSCVNPSHLFLGTQHDNMKDCQRKGRLNPGRGSRHRSSILNEEQVIEIKKSKERNKYFCDLYGVTQHVISEIRHGRSWKHVAI